MKKCSRELERQGKSYPRFCSLCDLGPCHEASKSGDAVAITPEMIEAGVAALVEWENSTSPYPAMAVSEIYSRMEAVRTGVARPTEGGTR